MLTQPFNLSILVYTGNSGYLILNVHHLAVENVEEGPRFSINCANIGDQATADMFTGATKELDKLTWMI